MEDPTRANGSIDKLSDLPDDLRARILSLLSTKDAVRTSLLSSSWRYSYTSISNLDLEFNSENLKKTDEKDCMDFVDRFLECRDEKCVLDKFELIWKMSLALDPLRLENWIKIVLWHGIRVLGLEIYNFKPNDLLLPFALFSCETLEVLKLNAVPNDLDFDSDSSTASEDIDYISSNESNTVSKDLDSNSGNDSTTVPEDLHFGSGNDSNTVSENLDYDYGLKLPAKICLPSLKSIHLKNINFSRGDSWSRLFSSCPILEDFLFSFKCGRCNLVVSSPTLKRLTIDCSGDYVNEGGSFSIVVDAPSLAYLEYSVFKVESLKFVNTQSLVEANIESFRYGLEMTSLPHTGNELMRGISNVQTLRMCALSIHALRTFDIQIPVLHNLTHLTIHHDFHFGLVALPYLLEKCESIETLVFEDLCEWHSEKWNEVEESRIRCLRIGLRTFKFYQFKGKDYEFEMVKYFLRTAMLLELIEIHLHSECEDASRINEELKMLPRNSEARMDIVF